MKVAVKTLENKSAGDLTLDDAVFGVDVKEDIIHRMVQYQLHKRRAGTHKTKQRHEVNGRGKKPWRQKGTGRARAGDLKRNIDRGGAVVFGPTPRSHAVELPKKIRRLAMKMALSSKCKAGKLVILDKAEAKEHKTKPMASAFLKLGFESAVVVCGKEVDVNFARATRNLPRIDVLPSQGANVYDIIRRDTLVLTKDAVNDLTESLKG
jgi:large subunit ribosomal protein L4